MGTGKNLFRFLPIYILFSIAIILLTLYINQAVTAFHQSKPYIFQNTFIIDAGHGGVDGGATSCTGVLESNINLEISLKLNDMMHLLGLNTVMIRTEDISVYTQGHTIAAKKISDLKERLRIINNTPGAILISIHQNHFTDPKYSGAQVFYAKTEHSQPFAEAMQKTMQQTLNTSRAAKKADGIYLMKNVNCPAILIECGFISNPQEAQLLLTSEYQKKLCATIAIACAEQLEQFDQFA